VSLTRLAWRWHRWLGWVVGIQVVVWLTSGLVFAWLPFQSWVKGSDVLARPELVMPALPPALAGLAPADVTALAAVATPRGAAWRVVLRRQAAPLYLPIDGSAWRAPDADAVRSFAQSLVKGAPPVLAVERLAQVPTRLLMVDEAGGRSPVWRVSFDDSLQTRIYLDGRGGEFVALRNEAWVWYDFFWRLHIMDYGAGEDFNHPLIRAAASAGWLLVAAGSVLSLLAVRRGWRRRSTIGRS
jgi:hypothetical protein